MRRFHFICVFTLGCASTAPGRPFQRDGSADTGPPADGGSWSDAGQCPPMTWAGTACKGSVSCWADCFSCLGNPPSWDKHTPLTYRCINGEYGASGSVTCWNGRYRDIACTMPFDGGK